jgi:hypothetical protein
MLNCDELKSEGMLEINTVVFSKIRKHISFCWWTEKKRSSEKSIAEMAGRRTFLSNRPAAFYQANKRRKQSPYDMYCCSVDKGHLNCVFYTRYL